MAYQTTLAAKFIKNGAMAYQINTVRGATGEYKEICFVREDGKRVIQTTNPAGKKSTLSAKARVDAFIAEVEAAMAE